ncbi:MAG: hypothetical protein K9W44_12915 [Candidatus Lokiarchaeota archaeon]|nr:hypothetical protein [Candidatus Harpocratesius repetitus]
MALIQILGYIFESVAIISGVIAAITAIHRDPKYRANQLMASSMIFIALYAFLIMLYDISFFQTGNPKIIYFSYPQAIIAIVGASIFLFLTMQTIINSSHWLAVWWHWGIHIIILVIFGILVNVVDFITIIESENVDTQINLWVLAIVVILLLYYLSQSIWTTYVHGIKKSHGNSKKKLIIFESGLIIDFIAIFVNVLSQMASNISTGQILDLIFFGLIAVGNVIYSVSFILPSANLKACIDCD